MKRRSPVPAPAALLGLSLSIASCAGEPEPGFAGPAAACYDAAADVYLVSNVDGGRLDADGAGSIVVVRPEDGRRSLLVDGARDGVTLNAPKGMALVGDVLWVADVDVLRRFERASGAPLGEVSIPGATSLEGVSAGLDGSVYVTDSGLGPDLAPTGTDAIWKVDAEGGVSVVLRGEALGHPRGISAQKAGLYVVSWRDGSFYEVDFRGARTELGRAPQAQLDGLVRVEHQVAGADGQARMQPAWYATSWAGSAVYRFALTGGVTALPARLEQPGGAAYDGRRGRLVVPLSGADRLHVEAL